VTIDSRYLNHLCDDVLERFLMDRCFANELADVEMHIPCCESCVARLEELDLEIGAIRLCLRRMTLSPSAKASRLSESSLTLV